MTILGASDLEAAVHHRLAGSLRRMTWAVDVVRCYQEGPINSRFTFRRQRRLVPPELLRRSARVGVIRRSHVIDATLSASTGGDCFSSLRRLSAATNSRASSPVSGSRGEFHTR